MANYESGGLWAPSQFTSTAQKVGRDKTPPPPAPAPAAPRSYAADRVMMAEAGGPIVARTPALKEAVSRLGGDPTVTRGFAIAVGTLATQKYTVQEMRDSFVREDKDPAHQALALRGFDAGVAAFKGAQTQTSTVRSTGPSHPTTTKHADTIFGMPKLPVMIAGGAAVAGIAAYLLYPARVKAFFGVAGDRSRRYGGGRRYGR